MTLNRIFATLMVRSTIILLALKTYKDPGKAFKALKLLIRKRVAFSGTPGLPRFFYANGRYFFDPNDPGWPSKSFNRFIINELNNSLPFNNDHSRLTTIIFSITKKCPLRCQHCFEWDRLNNKESLSISDIKTILFKFQEYGISQVQIGGGEPITRFNDLISLLKTAGSGTDFWLLTSGFGLTLEKARQLKKAGLTGVRISLDHWDKEKHNAFRGSEKSFDWVVKAAENSIKAGMAMGLSACVTKELLTNENLKEYLKLARKLGAAFIFLLEPRETGHFKNTGVTLSEEEVKIIESFYLHVNSSAEFGRYPMVIYPGYHQRKLGCFGAGIRYLYVDSEGSIHACPFCQGELGNAVTDDLPELIQKVRTEGCQMFATAEFSFAR
jgi:MoaA/NifB/PqqE/SkfB family radical SAM enzyme